MNLATEPIRVLHVDDDPAFTNLVSAFLERGDAPLEIHAASSANDGLERLADGEFDCIVSDYDMPGTNGLEFLTEVRERYGDLPFVLFTGKGSEEIAGEAISAGVTDYLQKRPGSERYELLANRIVNGVEQHRAEGAAERTRERLHELAESCDDVLWLFGSRWDELLFVNSAYEEIYGRSIETLHDRPRSFLDAVHPEDRERVERAMEGVSAGRSIDVEYRVNEAEAYGRWVRVQAEPIRDGDGNVIRAVGFSRDVTEHKRHRRGLENLHAATRELIRAESKREVAEIVSRTLRDLLAMDVNGCWLYDADAEALRPVASTFDADGVVDDLPTYREGEGLSWEAFVAGEARIYDDVSAQPGRYNAGTRVRSEIIVPIGGYGVLNVGAAEPGAFGEEDLSLPRLLAANAEAVMGRIERRASLREERAFAERPDRADRS